MKNIKICTVETGSVDIQIDDNVNVDQFFSAIKANQEFRQVNPDGTGVLVPYHAIKMVMISKKDNHEGVETKQ